MANNDNSRKSSFFLPEDDGDGGKRLLDSKASPKKIGKTEPEPKKSQEDSCNLSKTAEENTLPPESLENATAEHNEEILENTDEPWRQCNGLPATDMKQKDWTKYNRKLAYMYPAIILPGWKHPSDMK